MDGWSAGGHQFGVKNNKGEFSPLPAEGLVDSWEVCPAEAFTSKDSKGVVGCYVCPYNWGPGLPLHFNSFCCISKRLQKEESPNHSASVSASCKNAQVGQEKGGSGSRPGH